MKAVSTGLARRGHNVTVATSRHPTRRQFSTRVTVREFGVTGSPLTGYRGEVDAYRDFLRKSNFDVSLNYAAQCWPTDLAFRELEKMRGRKILAPCGYSGLAFGPPIGWLFVPYFLKLPRVLRKYDHLIYHSPVTIDKLFGDRHGIKSFSIIPNGVDTSLFQGEGDELPGGSDVRPDQPLLLHVGNHQRVKGHRGIFAALKALDALGCKEWEFVLIGEPSPSKLTNCLSDCIHAAASFGGRVHLSSRVSRERVVSAFKGADIFILSSKIECFPLVVLEAMSAQSPIPNRGMAESRSR